MKKQQQQKKKKGKFFGWKSFGGIQFSCKANLLSLRTNEQANKRTNERTKSNIISEQFNVVVAAWGWVRVQKWPPKMRRQSRERERAECVLLLQPEQTQCTLEAAQAAHTQRCCCLCALCYARPLAAAACASGVRKVNQQSVCVCACAPSTRQSLTNSAPIGRQSVRLRPVVDISMRC